MKISNQFIVAVIAALLIQSVNALTLFSDGFESGNLIGWQLTGIAQNWTVNQTDPHQGAWNAQARPLSSLLGASIMQKAVSTADYQNITLSYYRKLVELDASDEFRVKWYDGTNWITLEQTASNEANDSDYIFKSFAIPLATNRQDFAFRFECSAQALNEYCRIDDIVVSANQQSLGILPYMPGMEYSVQVINTTIVFTRTNDTYESYAVPLDSQNHFTYRKNYVWFNGQIINSTLYLNQYVGLNIIHSANTNETFPGIFESVMVISALPYLGITTPTTIQIIIDQNQQTSTIAPLNYPALSTTTPIDSYWNASGHAYSPMLFQTQLQNGTIAVEEWITVDPSWTVPLS